MPYIPPPPPWLNSRRIVARGDGKITQRDLFAAAALNALLSNSCDPRNPAHQTELACRIADAMVAQMSQTN